MDFTASVSIEDTVDGIDKVDDGMLLTLINNTKVFIPNIEVERIIKAYKDE